MPEISVIMGIYNCAPTLGEAIDSILTQTFTDWELIMCDDGSSDNTYTIAEEYRAKYPDKIKVLKNDHNLGLNKTLNICLAKAKGKYVARMDGDDISLPARFEKELSFLSAHPEFSIVSTPMIFFDETGDWGESTVIREPSPKDFIHHNPVHCHAPCMILRSAYLDVGGYTEDDRMLRFEDINLWFKLYSKGYKGYNLDEPLYKMRDDRDAAHRRSLKSRMNCVYVMYDGFRRLQFPWYLYGFIGIDFVEHFIKGIIPEKLYMVLHKKRMGKQ